MKSFVKQILAISLALILVLSLVPSAVAEENLRNADNTEQEYTRHGLGRLPARPHDTPKSPDDLSNVQESNGTSASDLPEKYDSRDLGCITPVRDQGNHNTCWTFGALASCEAYMIKHGVNVGDSGSVTFSPMNYCQLVLRGNYTNAHKDVVKALYKYSQAADTFFNS